MPELTRREFFQYLTLRALNRAQKTIGKTTRALDAAAPAPRGAAQCARCYARFEPQADEILCAVCRENDARQRALLEHLPPRK
jgi:hypothetical protein